MRRFFWFLGRNRDTDDNLNNQIKIAKLAVIQKFFLFAYDISAPRLVVDWENFLCLG